MGSPSERFACAIEAFDAYHRKDPNAEIKDGASFPSELLYVQRLTDRLNAFAPHASEAVKLAARCQHIGRWEIPRNKYPQDKKGYLQWRNEEKMRHAQIAEQILQDCDYEKEMIDNVKLLLLKKELHSNAGTQLLEDVVCMVFLEFYLDDFSTKHSDEKVVDILRKTIKKMSAEGKKGVDRLNLSDRTRALVERAEA